MSKLASVMAGLNKKETIVGALGEVPREHGGISWGLAGLDARFKTRGVPRGRMSMVVASQNAGKSTLAMGVAAALHRDVDRGTQARGMVVYVDSERTFEESYAAAIGVDIFDPERFILMRPTDGIEFLDAIEQMVETGEVDLVILDSLTFLVPRAMLEADPGKNLPAVQARQNSMLVLRLTGLLARTNTAMLIVNHLTGTMKVDFHGNPILEIRGGDMVKNAMSAILWIKKAARPVDAKGNPVKAADMNESVAADCTIELYKNKLGRQNLRLPARLVFGSGFDPVYDLVQTAFGMGVLEKAGAWVRFGERKWNGENAAIAEISEDVGLFEELRAAVLGESDAETEEAETPQAPVRKVKSAPKRNA